MTVTTIRERLGWDVTPELYGRSRHLWIDHSGALVEQLAAPRP